MISDSKFKTLKNILLKNFTDTTLMIILNGTIQTKILITDSKITICKTKKTRKRWLLTEAVVLLGFRDTFRILLSKEYRCRLYKQFYKITFTKK